MSHVSSIAIEINDLDALDAACKTLGLELIRGQKTYKWYGRWVNDYSQGDAAYKNGIDPKDYGKCEHAIRVVGKPGAYEVGVARTTDGKLTLVWDLWAGGRGLQEAIGDKGSKLLQEYAMQVGMKEMMTKGFRVEREFNTVTNKPRMRAWK